MVFFVKMVYIKMTKVIVVLVTVNHVNLILQAIVLFVMMIM